MINVRFDKRALEEVANDAVRKRRTFARVVNGQAGAGTPSRTMTGKTRSVFCSYADVPSETMR